MFQLPKEPFQQLLHRHKLHPRGTATELKFYPVAGLDIPVFANEFWTSQQRKANPLHEISYRACFKPQLPAFFINALTKPNDIVYDPFSGRGTTVIEAALLGRKVVANDINPLSIMLTRPRIEAPTPDEIEKRLEQIVFDKKAKADIDLSMFYNRQTEAELVSLQHYLQERIRKKKEDNIDRWIRMVATNRLTGHSPGFFSVYTLPPNQAITAERQKKINRDRKQKPEYRDVKKLILRKSRVLLKGLDAKSANNLKNASALFVNNTADNTSQIPACSVALTVTSPPFLDVVQYAGDNWLRCWFNGVDVNRIEKKITMSKTVEEWAAYMQDVFRELYRITKKGGWVAFEVGEVRKGKIKLEEAVVPLGIKAGFKCIAIMINQQNFTKTANIWGISNNTSGTNSNRIVVFKKS